MTLSEYRLVEYEADNKNFSYTLAHIHDTSDDNYAQRQDFKYGHNHLYFGSIFGQLKKVDPHQKPLITSHLKQVQ